MTNQECFISTTTITEAIKVSSVVTQGDVLPTVTSGSVRQRDKLKKLNPNYHNTYCYECFKDGDLQRQVPTLKVS